MMEMICFVLFWIYLLFTHTADGTGIESEESMKMKYETIVYILQ